MSTPVIVRTNETVRRIAGSGPQDLAEAGRRLNALGAVTHPGVVVPTGVDVEDDGTVVVTMPRIRGDDLGVVRRLRGGLSVGECVAVGIDVAEALAAVHDARLTHGDVSPANVIVTGARCVLIDTFAGATRSERGTPGFAAPERPVGATAAGDVYSLGRVLEFLADDSASERVGAWVAPLLAPDPTARPTALEVAHALRACAPPTPVAIPVTSVAAMMRARALPPEEQTVRLARGRRWRMRKLAIRVAAIGAGAAALGLVIALLLAALGAVTGGPDYRYLPTIPRTASELAAPPDIAASGLLEARIAALASGDSAALLSTTSAAGPARAADAELADRLTTGRLRYEALAVEVTGVETLAVDGNAATVRLTYIVPAHRVWEGETVTSVRETVTVVDLDVAWSDGAWRVTASRPPP